MSLNYELRLYPNYLTLNYYWEYGWGLGRVELPNIELRFNYSELKPYFNQYALDLLY